MGSCGTGLGMMGVSRTGGGCGVQEGIGVSMGMLGGKQISDAGEGGEV